MTRVAVVGAGKMGAHHARVFARCAKLTGVHDVDPDRAARVARGYGGVCFTDIGEAIASSDLVVVATPTACHFTHASRALMADRHVLVEKPLCVTGSDAWALCELARSRGVQLFVGHSERFNPWVRTVARLTRGEPLVKLVTHRILRPTRVEEPCLNLAVHDIDLAAFLSGGEVGVIDAHAHVNTVHIALRMPRGRALVKVGYGGPLRTLAAQTAHQTLEGDLAMSHRVEDEPLWLQAKAVLAALHRHPSDAATGADGAQSVTIALEALAFVTQRVTFNSALR